ncbi:hypothetical protein KP509_14G098200 [Ceratopteris richardii]|nr:hypothetical protein KP509_14G098200 [Ceratopteris richardii]
MKYLWKELTTLSYLRMTILFIQKKTMVIMSMRIHLQIPRKSSSIAHLMNSVHNAPSLSVINAYRGVWQCCAVQMCEKCICNLGSCISLWILIFLYLCSFPKSLMMMQVC